jgi:hypothetical protein
VSCLIDFNRDAKTFYCKVHFGICKLHGSGNSSILKSFICPQRTNKTKLMLLFGFRLQMRKSNLISFILNEMAKLLHLYGNILSDGTKKLFLSKK